jgi:hypothetical protein
MEPIPLEFKPVYNGFSKVIAGVIHHQGDRQYKTDLNIKSFALTVPA